MKKYPPIYSLFYKSVTIVFLLLSSVVYATDRTSLTLAAENWPPYSYLSPQNNKVIGLSTEIIEKVLKNMDVSITYNNIYPWARAQQEVFKGNIDAAYTASYSTERDKFCYFPVEAIIESDWVLFIHSSEKSRLKFSDYADLTDKSIGLVRGYNYPKAFKTFISDNSNLQYVSDEVQNINKLLHQRFDYMPAVKETVLFLSAQTPILLQKHASSKLYAFPKTIKKAKFYLMFSKKTVSAEFVQQFSSALAEFKLTSEYTLLRQKYLKL